MLLLLLNDRLRSLLRWEERNIPLDLLEFRLVHRCQESHLKPTLLHGVVQNGDGLQDSIVSLLIGLFKALTHSSPLFHLGFEQELRLLMLLELRHS